MLIIISSFFISCSSTYDTWELDSKVNQAIIKVFHEQNPELWTLLEIVFYNRLEEMDLFDKEGDTLESFVKMMDFVAACGYPNNFYLDTLNAKTKVLLNELNQIGYSNTYESSHRFLFNIINPILKEYDDLINDEDSRNNLLISIGLTSPDSIKLARFEGIAPHLITIYDKNNLKNPGLYKVLTLFYFSIMMQSPKKQLIKAHNTRSCPIGFSVVT